MPGTAAAASPFELAFDRLPVAAVILDPKGRIVHANPPACGMLRGDLGDLAGKSLTGVVEADDPTWCSTDPVDRLGDPSPGRQIKAKIGGKRRLLSVEAYALAGEGEERGSLITLRDAEEGDVRLAQDQRDSLEELCACVAHEIRNPLTGIRTTVQFVTSKLGPEHRWFEELREVIKEMDRIEEIIGDLLRFGRPAELTREKGDLNALLERALDSMEPQCREAEVEVKRNLHPELPPFLFGSDSLQQVITNLIRNAIEAMPEGGRIKVTTTVRRFSSGRPPQVEIFVSDTGHGIPDDLLGDIFKPFFTTRHNGTGLGLPISLGIVRAHGGRVTARNRPRGGATFRIILPLVTLEDGK